MKKSSKKSAVGKTVRLSDAAAADRGDSGLAPAADRALRILETFERIGEPLTLSRLAEEIGAPISSCHNLVRTLSGRGYLFSLDSQKAFYPTRKLWDLASSIVSNDPILQQILPRAEALRDATSETVLVGKRQDFTALYLLTLEGTQNIRYVSAPGRKIPLHTSAIGKALLSTMTDEEFEAWLQTGKLEKITAKTITDCEVLRQEIRNGKARGYFVNSGENVADVSAIAAVFMMNRDAFAIGVAGPTTRIVAARPSILRALKEAIGEFRSAKTPESGLRVRK